MTFEVSADSYARFMGRFSEPLAARFLQLCAPGPGAVALDVGCGPGALTSQLVRRLGTAQVAAVDPSEQFCLAARDRFPDIQIQRASAEHLPFDDGTFDLTAAQLVVHFMSDPVAGLAEMARVTEPGGQVAACVWDHAGGAGPLSTFWAAVCAFDPAATDESQLAGAREGHLVELFAAADLPDARQSTLTVRSRFETFDEWWQTFTLGVGPAGAYVAQLDGPRREALRAECDRRLPPAPFDVTASAWAAVATVGPPGRRPPHC